jgi:preprotein translocase subunit SecE
MDKLKALLEKTRNFLKEAKVELRKVTWPTPKQTLTSTSVVIFLVTVVSLFLAVVDFGLTKLLKLILG